MNQLNDFPLIKRFRERYQADAEFRQAYSRNPGDLLRSFGLAADSGRMDRVLGLVAGESGLTSPVPDSDPAGQIIQKTLRTPIPDPRIQDWRQRQIKRIQAFYHVSVFRWILHAPMAFELSKGCSGRCAFCCFDPPPLSGVFRLDGPARQLWCEILAESRRALGPVMDQAAACYFATEPFDNPDYETFAADFKQICGFWPQLTTVKCLDDVSRTRQYISRVGPDAVQAGMVRFSVTSLKMLRAVHAEYSPEELAHVELLLNNPESTWKYSPAGRARKLQERFANTSQMANKFYLPGPTACVTGFVVNLVDREIRLISTCTPDQEHPHGYILFDTARFNTADEYRDALERLVTRNMPDFPPADWILAFSQGFRFVRAAHGCEWSTKFLTRRVSGDGSFIRMCEMIAEGRYTWNEISASFGDAWITEMYLKPKLSLLMNLGLIREPAARKKALP